MSTNFYVLPGNEHVPTYKEVLDLANININAYLSSIGIQHEVDMSVNLQNTETHSQVEFDITDTITQSETEYAWFYIPTVPGGTGCLFCKMLPDENDAWKDEIEVNPRARKYRENISKSLALGYQWVLRRSAGQPAIIALAYGMLAASLASLTDGIIYSDDGAWDYSTLPACADEFLTRYFRHEHAVEDNTRVLLEMYLDKLKSGS